MKCLLPNKKGHLNLLTHQCKPLSTLVYHHDFIIFQCDNNLGPYIIRNEVYISQSISKSLSYHYIYHLLTHETKKTQSSKFAEKLHIHHQVCKVTDTHAIKITVYRVRGKYNTFPIFIPDDQTTKSCGKQDQYCLVEVASSTPLKYGMNSSYKNPLAKCEATSRVTSFGRKIFSASSFHPACVSSRKMTY